jgi:hypothetical protein
MSHKATLDNAGALTVVKWWVLLNLRLQLSEIGVIVIISYTA